jgi:hypothetical protein
MSLLNHTNPPRRILGNSLIALILEEKFYIEISCQQRNHGDERVCGDVFLSRRIREEGRIVVVLSDGLGHGIKANLLATLTSTLAVNFTQEHKNIDRIAEIIMDTLPVDNVKQLNYSTFTIIDVDQDGNVNILEYENPKTLLLRGNRILEPGWNCIVLSSEKNAGKEVLCTNFKAAKEDRIVFFTDGVAQSGLGSDRYPVGWGEGSVNNFIIEALKEEHDISAVKLASMVINRANQNDDFNPKDDISCAVIYFREPRKLMICSGPPLDPVNDTAFANILQQFQGNKIICGATTGNMIAREWGTEIVDETIMLDPELPPVSHMKGVDLITEGILTLSKVSELLKKYNQNYKPGKGPADEIIRMILESDEIHFIVGTSINIAHQDPTLPVELELRRTVVHRIVRVLDEKFLKETKMTFY